MFKKYFDDAINFEKKGYDLYKELEKNAKDNVSKRLFASLAEQENYHIQAIERFAQDQVFIEQNFMPLEEQIKEVFLKAEKDKDNSIDNVKGIEKAMVLEEDGYNIYKNACQAADGKELEFLTKLMNMEKEHYESLANVHFYYTDNEHWLSESESNVWNWMNF